MASIFESWESIGGGRRVSLIVGAGLVLVLTIVAFMWLTDKDYQVLFGDLEPRDAAGVVAELERLKIDYQLANAGSDIMVPAVAVHDVRLKLMGTGVPLSGGVGFEIFDNSDFGMTDFAQRINYQRALEGELTRTVMSLKEVKYARVHLVMPDKGLFQQDDSSPSASVTLFLKQEFMHAAKRPSNAQIAGIQRLVSAAVPNLKVAQVTVSDQTGVTLSQQLPEQEGLAAISGRLKQKRSVEDYLTQKVNDVLAHTFGEDQAKVSIDATLNFNEVKRTNENVVDSDNANSGVVRRRETRMTPGADSSKTSGNVTTEVEYKLGRTIEQIIESPGEILRLSVGIMVPADTSQQRRDEISQLVEMTVGLDRTRGDALSVHTMNAHSKLPAQTDLFLDTGTPLADSSRAQAAEAVSPAIRLINAHPIAAGAIGSALGLLLLLALFRGTVKRPPENSSVATLSTTEREEALQKLSGWLDRADTTTTGEAV